MCMVKILKDIVVYLGISVVGMIMVWLNNKQVYYVIEKQLQVFIENVYNCFVFLKGFDVLFCKGNNELLICYEVGKVRLVVFLCLQQVNGDLNMVVDFMVVQLFIEWYIMGLFVWSDSWFFFGKNKLLYVVEDGKWYNWYKLV